VYVPLLFCREPLVADRADVRVVLVELFELRRQLVWMGGSHVTFEPRSAQKPRGAVYTRKAINFPVNRFYMAAQIPRRTSFKFTFVTRIFNSLVYIPCVRDEA